MELVGVSTKLFTGKRFVSVRVRDLCAGQNPVIQDASRVVVAKIYDHDFPDMVSDLCEKLSDLAEDNGYRFKFLDYGIAVFERDPLAP